MAYITGSTSNWEYVIGLEVHAQVKSKSKLFSGTATEFGSKPNTQVSLIDAAMPGMLPVLNEYCVKQAIKTGLSLNAQINTYSVFDRKNYFYPDLPQGYQISQFYHPIVQNGYINITLDDGKQKKIRINRVHLEQDAGKSMHDQSESHSFIDLNRCGIALMEIVTEPDIRSPEEAAQYVKKLRTILRYIGTCDGDMEKGSMRCDVNISMRRPGESLGTRCEIKNVNSIRNIIKAIEFEASRQVVILEQNKLVNQETMLFDANTQTTRVMRSKEDAHDYRYFPDPDLLPVCVTQELIDSLSHELPELPDKKVDRYIKEFNLNITDASVIVSDINHAKYFESTTKICYNAKLVANWIISELFGYLNKHNINLSTCKITPDMLGSMLNMIENNKISGKIAKTVFELMFATGEDPETIVKEHNLMQVDDNAIIINTIQEVLKENAQSVIDYKNGKDKLFGFFVGQVMKKTKGKANPAIVNKLLKKELQ